MRALLRYCLRVRCRDGQWRTQAPVKRTYPDMAEAIEAKERLVADLGVAAPSRAELALPNPPRAAYVVAARAEPLRRP